MNDEVTQAVELEVKGIYYLIEGTKEMIALMARGISALSEWKYEKWLNAPGECSWQKIQEASEGAAPILEFPAEMFEPQILPGGRKGPSVFEEYCREHELRYCILPDLDPSDDYIPVAVVDKDISIHQEYIKKAMNARIDGEEEKEESYEEKIREAQQKSSDPALSAQERRKAEETVEILSQAKEENHALLTESKEKAGRENVLPFDEYLKMARGTKYETDMEGALKSYNKVGGMVREYMPAECMYPIRDMGKVPESREIYYSQTTKDDRIYTVRRNFDTDEQGTVYSTYHIFRPDETGQEMVFTDAGMSQEAWKKQLPIMLQQAGMQMDVPTAAIQSKERLTRYVRSVEENFSQASFKGQFDGKTEEPPKPEEGLTKEEIQAKKLTESILSDEKQKAAYEDSMRHTVTVSPELLMFTDHQTIAYETDDGLVDGIELLSMDKDGACVSINDAGKYPVLDAGGKEKKEISGAELTGMIEDKKTRAEAVAAIRLTGGDRHGRLQ